jgi:hypothetical protein
MADLSPRAAPATGAIGICGACLLDTAFSATCLAGVERMACGGPQECSHFAPTSPPPEPAEERVEEDQLERMPGGDLFIHAATCEGGCDYDCGSFVCSGCGTIDPTLAHRCPAPALARPEEPATCPGPNCPLCSGEACALCGPTLGTDVSLGKRPPCEHDAVQRHREPPTPTVLTGCQMRDTPETRELVAAAGRMLAGGRGPAMILARWRERCPCDCEDCRALTRVLPSPVSEGRAPPPGEERLRERIEKIADEWEQEALRRDRDAASEKTASKRDRLILGAGFERNHADALRAALREDEKGAKP